MAASRFDSLHVDFVTCNCNYVDFQENYWSADTNWQTEIINATVKHPLVLKYPPALKYRKKFIKRLIDKVEEKGLEVSEDLYHAYFQLLNRKDEDEISYYKTYYSKDLNLRIVLEENKNIISQATTGLTTWEASIYLANCCLASKQIFHAKKILELGCGTGFTGIAVSLVCQPTLYCFTDVHEEVLNQLRRNIEINLKEQHIDLNQTNERVDKRAENFINQFPKIEIKKYDWREDIDFLDNYDFILAADVVYDPDVIPFLVEALNKLLEKIPTAFVASALRNDETVSCFFKALGKANIKYCLLDSNKSSAFHHIKLSTCVIWKLFKIN